MIHLPGIRQQSRVRRVWKNKNRTGDFQRYPQSVYENNVKEAEISPLLTVLFPSTLTLRLEEKKAQKRNRSVTPVPFLPVLSAESSFLSRPDIS